MKELLRNIFVLVLILNCSSSDDSTEDAIVGTETIDQTLIAADNPKKTYAKINVSSDKTQILKASSQSVLSGTEVLFSPGCMTSDSDIAEISLEEGVSTYFEVGVEDFDKIDRDSIVKHETPLLLNSTDASLGFSCDFTINFPLKNISLSLLGEQVNIVLFYHVFDQALETYVSGFKSISNTESSVVVKARKLGAYQVVYLKTPLAENLENSQSSQQAYITKVNDVSDNGAQVVIDQKNIIIGGNTATGQAPTAVLFDGEEIDPSVNERSPKDTLVANLSAIDSDLNDSFVFSLSGQERDYFYISDNKLYVNKVFQYTEGSTKNIIISVSDSFGFIYSQNIMVKINNIHPTKILLNNESEITVDEYIAVDSTLATLSVDQGGFSDSLWIYEISGNDSNYFYIDGSSLKIANIFYYIDKQSLDISIKVDDQYGISFSDNFTIPVNNLLPQINLTGDSIHEEKNPGVQVGTLSSNEVVTFSLVSGNGDTNNDDFIIDGTTLRTSKTLSYASGSTRSIRVRATEEIYYEAIFIITVQESEAQSEDLILSATSGASETSIFNSWQKINSGSKTLTSVNLYFKNSDAENNYDIYLDIYDTDDDPSSANPGVKFTSSPVMQSDTITLPKNTTTATEFKFTISGESLNLNTDYYIRINTSVGTNPSWTNQRIIKYGDGSTTGGAGNSFGQLNHEVYGIDP